MKLHFEGAPEIVTSRAHVWRCLMDPNFVAQSAPGVESVTTIDPTHFTVISAFGVGAIGGCRERSGAAQLGGR
jgi:carbon monoxide dehydrogenase subunit G